MLLTGCSGGSSDGPEDDVRPLTAEELAEFEEMFASTTVVKDGETGEYLYTTSTPVSCFFTSYYADPRDIDLADFLRYCPLGAALEDTGAEEFRAVLAAWGAEMPERFETPSDYMTPVWRIAKSDVSALLTQWAGITVDELRSTEGVTYLARYDAFYNDTSDFGPGVFVPTGGERDYESVRLWNDAQEELTLRVNGGGYLIASFLNVQ